MSEREDASVHDETTDVERGRAFLERLWAVTDPPPGSEFVPSDENTAFNVLSMVFHWGKDPHDLRADAVAALGRVLRESA